MYKRNRAPDIELVKYELKIAMLFFIEKTENFVSELETIHSEQKIYKEPNKNSRIEKDKNQN